MLYAVTIEPLNVIAFVYDPPGDHPWDVEEGVELDINPLFGTWTPDLGPLHQTLCVSTTDPKYYKVFQHSKDLRNKEFRPTGRRFGGVFSKATWERYVKRAPSLIAALCSEDEDPIGETREAVASIEQGG